MKNTEYALLYIHLLISVAMSSLTPDPSFGPLSDGVLMTTETGVIADACLLGVGYDQLAFIRQTTEITYCISMLSPGGTGLVKSNFCIPLDLSIPVKPNATKVNAIVKTPSSALRVWLFGSATSAAVSRLWKAELNVCSGCGGVPITEFQWLPASLAGVDERGYHGGALVDPADHAAFVWGQAIAHGCIVKRVNPNFTVDVNFGEPHYSALECSAAVVVQDNLYLGGSPGATVIRVNKFSGAHDLGFLYAESRHSNTLSLLVLIGGGVGVMSSNGTALSASSTDGTFNTFTIAVPMTATKSVVFGGQVIVGGGDTRGFSVAHLSPDLTQLIDSFALPRTNSSCLRALAVQAEALLFVGDKCSLNTSLSFARELSDTSTPSAPTPVSSTTFAPSASPPFPSLIPTGANIIIEDNVVLSSTLWVSQKSNITIHGYVVLGGELTIALTSKPPPGGTVSVTVLSAESISGNFSSVSVTATNLVSCESLLIQKDQRDQETSLAYLVSIDNSACGISRPVLGGIMGGIVAAILLFVLLPISIYFLMRNKKNSAQLAQLYNSEMQHVVL